MTEITDQAADHLRIIRELMLRTTVYRAISAPTALFAGILAVVTAGVLIGSIRAGTPIDPGTFVAIWLGVYFVADAFHAYMLWKNHEMTGEPFVSSNMMHALKLLVPPMFAGGVVGLTMALAPGGSVAQAACCWSIFYGLALLATVSFSPRSMTVLGAVFLLGGLVLLVVTFACPSMLLNNDAETGTWIMGGTFGALHLIYGLIVKFGAPSP